MPHKSEAGLISEESIIQSILASQTETEDPLPEDRKKIIILRYKGKELSIIYHFEADRFDSHIRNINDGSSRTEGATTVLHKAAKRVMQEIANRERRNICYQFYAYNEKMKQWGRTRGQEIFGFTQRETNDNPEERDLYTVDFIPDT